MILLLPRVLGASTVDPTCESSDTSRRSQHQVAIIAEIDSLRVDSQLDAALALAATHVMSAKADSDSTFLLKLLLRQGSMWAGIGEVRRAEHALREALELAEIQQDSWSICYVLRWLSVAVSNQGRGIEASEMCARLLHFAGEQALPEYEGWALVGLGWQALSTGQATEAIDLYRQAIPALRSKNIVDGLAWAWNGLGISQLRLGAYDQALTSYRRAAAVAERIEVTSMRRYVMGSVLNNLSTLEFGFGDPSVAAGHFRKAYELHLSGGNQRGAMMPGLNLAMCLTEVGRYAEAIEELESLAQSCREAGYLDLLGSILNELALAHRSQGCRKKAAAICRQSIALGNTQPTRTLAEAHINLARVLSETDSSESALSVLDEGARLLETAPDAELDLTLRAARGRALHRAGRHRMALPYLLEVEGEERQRGLSRLSLGVLVTAARACIALDRPDSALALLERAAAHWESDRGAPLDPKWREQRGAWSRTIYTELAVLLLDVEGDLPEFERIRNAFDRLQVFKARTLMERVRGPSSPAGDPPGLPEEDLATLEAVQTEGLRPGELFLDVFLGPGSSIVFAVTRGECRVLRLPAGEALAPRLRLYRRMIETPPSPDNRVDNQLLQDVRETVGRQLFGELGDLLDGCDRITIAPDGILNLLPLSELLPTAADEGIAPGAVKEIVRIPSASYLVWLRRNAAVRETDEDMSLLAIAAEQGEHALDLPGAVDEVQRLDRRFRNVTATIVEVDSCPTDLANQLADYDILHLAAHAEVDDQNPWRSAILLCPGTEEAYLHADRITTLPLQARLAVLSSCTSAGGRVLSGEGVLGLCTAFLSAGVPAVVATLWEVEDRSTARFMNFLYTHLASGCSAAEALAAAREDLRADPRMRHPYFWAGFVLTGDGDVRVNLIPRQESRRLQLGVLILIAMAGALILWYRRRGNSRSEMAQSGHQRRKP